MSRVAKTALGVATVACILAACIELVKIHSCFKKERDKETFDRQKRYLVSKRARSFYGKANGKNILLNVI